MAPTRFFTDEDVYGSVTPKLREKGVDAVSTPEANRLGENDESQLQWAAQEGRVFLTFNVGHFARLHHEWLSDARHHAAIIVSSQRPIGDLLRRILALASALSADKMIDRLEYLTNW
ncbi:MAG: DUF5615 family PIN-like protein [Planctomycetota bacterium]|nr:DUF5615 family PIN-like protein [Planctomycetota bacterium]